MWNPDSVFDDYEVQRDSDRDEYNRFMWDWKRKEQKGESEDELQAHKQGK